MLESSDLRIGNLIMNTKGEVDIVNLEALAYILREPSHQCEPIPLTDEWLIKFGILANVNGWHILFIKDHENIVFNPMYECNFKNIKHVHQLQNLYKALTGEDLEIKTK